MDVWIKRSEVQIIADCGKDKARELMKLINDDLEKKGIYIADHRRVKKELVLEKLGLQGETK